MLVWIEETSVDSVTIKKQWLVPQEGINKGRKYECRPVGNFPEFNPLDNSLNTDIKRSHDRHCILTTKLHIKDPRKFSMQTLRLISRGIHRLFECVDGEEGVPKSERTMHDRNEVWNLIWEVYEEVRIIVALLADRNGGWYSKLGTGNHGDEQIKG